MADMDRLAVWFPPKEVLLEEATKQNWKDLIIIGVRPDGSRLIMLSNIDDEVNFDLLKDAPRILEEHRLV